MSLYPRVDQLRWEAERGARTLARANRAEFAGVLTDKMLGKRQTFRYLRRR